MGRARWLGLGVLILAGCNDEEAGGGGARAVAASVQRAVVPARSQWTYYDQGFPGAGWNQRFYPADGWKSGRGPLGYGESYLTTVVSFGGDPARKHITTYFRKHFETQGRVLSLRLRVMYDDGFVFYLNGHEAGRAHMPTGTVLDGTRALGHEAGNAYVTFDVSSQIPRLEGSFHTIAFEVHQSSPSSSDLVFDAELIAEEETVADPGVSESIPRGSMWRYWDRGGLSSGWQAPAFDDAAWSVGAGPLGYGESYLRTTISFGPDASNKHVTSYFRRKVRVDDPSQVAGLRGEVMWDDGFVVYLNGQEIARSHLPSGPVGPSTRASGHEAGNAYTAFDWSHALPLLVAGENTVAVEVHQQAPSSSDLVFDLALAVETGRLPISIARKGAWRFWDGAGLGTSWRTSAFNDSAWTEGQGPFGFGETYIRTTTATGRITYYFRARFSVDDPARVRSLYASVMYDDGFVAYLNGQEVGRASMPSGSISNSTLAASHEARNKYETFDWSASVPFLVAGQNVLAVEVHQNAASSSDMVFDLGLAAGWFVQDVGTPVTGVSFVDEDLGWAVGGNQVRKTTDGGRTWSSLPAPPAELLSGVQFVGAFHGWVKADLTALFYTADGGVTWVPRTPPGGDRLWQMKLMDANNGFVTGRNPSTGQWTLYSTVNAGVNWAAYPLPISEPAFDFYDLQNGWAAGNGPSPDFFAVILKTTNGGATWTQQKVIGDNFDHPSAVQALHTGSGWVVGHSGGAEENGFIWHTADGGATWGRQSFGGGGLFDASLSIPGIGWVTGNPSKIYFTADGGATWVPQAAPIEDGHVISNLSVVTTNTVWAVAGGELLKTTTGGQ